MATLPPLRLSGSSRRRKASAVAPGFHHTLLIDAAPSRVVSAFFDPDALSIWWQALRSVTTPRVLGVYAVEWEPTPFSDEILGPLGGVFFGTVIDYRTDQGFAVGDALWLPPAGEPVGPMSLEVQCTVEGTACRLRVRQRGYEEGERWKHYYDVITGGWHASLNTLKHYLEQPAASLERQVRRRRRSWGGDGVTER
jgi:uncharacterized protein YndB with AHSA1/START domain